MDRFREPSEFCKAAGSHEETLGYRLQAMRAGPCYMAKGSQRGGSRGALSASRGRTCESPKQHSLRLAAPSSGRKRAGLVEVLFDSFLQPMLAGARSSGLWELDKCSIALTLTKLISKIEAKAGRQPPHGYRSIPGCQFAWNRRPRRADKRFRIIAETLCTRLPISLASFVARLENTGDPRAFLPRPGAEKSIVISLRNALGNLPGRVV